MSTMQISLSDQLVNKLQWVAATQGATLNEFLEQIANAYLPSTFEVQATEPPATNEQAWQEQRGQIAGEQRAYLAQHAQLLQLYSGEYIAIHHSQVIDHDANRALLGKRVRSRYGNQPIFITPVQPEPTQIIQVRSPRLTK